MHNTEFSESATEMRAGALDHEERAEVFAAFAAMNSDWEKRQNADLGLGKKAAVLALGKLFTS